MQSQQQWMVMGIICASLVQIFMAVESFPIADRITSLPGQPQFNFQQFSGYVTVDEKQQRSLFYYFVEAQTQPASKPLVLRLDGGPGCSSIGAGAFVEHGPFRPNGDSGNLVKKEYSWNRVANILYLESPAEVGFSYSAHASFYTNVNDTITGNNPVVVDAKQCKVLQFVFSPGSDCLPRDCNAECITKVGPGSTGLCNASIFCTCFKPC